MKYNVEKHANACNEFTTEYVQHICDALNAVQCAADSDELRNKTENLACVDNVIDIAKKNGVDVMQVLGYLKTVTALKSIEDTNQ